MLMIKQNKIFLALMLCSLPPVGAASIPSYTYTKTRNSIIRGKALKRKNIRKQRSKEYQKKAALCLCPLLCAILVAQKMVEYYLTHNIFTKITCSPHNPPCLKVWIPSRMLPSSEIFPEVEVTKESNVQVGVDNLMTSARGNYIKTTIFLHPPLGENELIKSETKDNTLTLRYTVKEANYTKTLPIKVPPKAIKQLKQEVANLKEGKGGKVVCRHCEHSYDVTRINCSNEKCKRENLHRICLICHNSISLLKEHRGSKFGYIVCNGCHVATHCLACNNKSKESTFPIRRCPNCKHKNLPYGTLHRC